MQKLITIFGLLIFLLVIRIAIVFHYEPEIPIGKPVKFSVIVNGEPFMQERYQRVNVRVLDRANILMYTSPKQRFSHGEELQVVGTIEERVIKGEKVGFSTYFPTIVPKNTAKNILYNKLSSFRENIHIFYEKSLPPTHASLLFGIVFGSRERMPENFDNALRRTGVMHVVAASGMNVALVAGAMLFLFGMILHRRAAIVISIFGIVAYTVLAGLSPSLVRAAIMGSIGLFAGLFGRQQLTIMSVFLAAGLMLFIDPLLLFDIGFQLSFAATIGIVVVTPLFPFMNKRKPETLLAGDFASTTSAQVTTLPILFYYFKNISILSIGVNMLVLWTVPLLMALGAIAALLGLMIEPLGRLVLYLTIPLLTYFITIIEFFGQFEFQVITLDTFPFALAIGYYCLLFALVLFLSRRKHDEKNS